MSSKKRIKKIKVTTSAKATHVSTFRERYRDKSKQTTLTQLLGTESDSDDNFIADRKRSAVIKKGRKKIVDLFESSTESDAESDTPTATIVTPPKKVFKSKDRNYTSNKSNAQPGDLVMATAGEIYHPALREGTIDSSFIFFGVMKYFSYEKWDKSGKDNSWDTYVKMTERVTVSWMTIEEGCRRYIDRNSPKPIDSISGYDTYVDIPPVKKDILRVLAKRNCSELKKVNGFLKKYVYKKFYFAKPEGWSEHVAESSSDTSD